MFRAIVHASIIGDFGEGYNAGNKQAYNVFQQESIMRRVMKDINVSSTVLK